MSAPRDEDLAREGRLHDGSLDGPSFEERAEEQAYDDWFSEEAFDPWRLNTALNKLVLLESAPDLAQRAFNAARMDAALTSSEEAVLRLMLKEERPPVEETLLLSAQSQIWVAYMSELLHTWQQTVVDIAELAETSVLEEEIEALEKLELSSSAQARQPQSKRAGYKSTYKSTQRKLTQHRLRVLKAAAREENLAQRIGQGLRKTKEISAQIDALRAAMERGDRLRTGDRGAMPVIWREEEISPETGSLIWVIADEADKADETSPVRRLSRRDIADALRALDAALDADLDDDLA